jgi:beta-lactamase superfamily II metal-dependent hydrolase
MNRSGADSDPMLIHIFDVGHGDSLIVEFPGGKHVGIVDCHAHAQSHRGFGMGNWDCSEPKALTYLKKRLDKKDYFEIVFVYLSHFHYDHCLGYSRLIKEMLARDVVIKALWHPGINQLKPKMERLAKDSTYPEHSSLMTELENFYRVLEPLFDQGIDCEPLIKPQRKLLNVNGVQIDVLAPHSDLFDGLKKFLSSSNWVEYSKENVNEEAEHAVCSALMLKYGKAKVILGGDLTRKAWEKLIDYWKSDNIRAQAVKVSHHGSVEGNFLPDGSSLWEHISIGGFTKAVISGGYRDKSPHSDTIADLYTKKVEMYCTGDFTQFLANDPVWGTGLSADLCQLFEVASQAVIETSGSYHGDILMRIYKDGTVETETEFNIPAVMGK